ncbi:holo-ACP synthase [Spongiibacter sp. KMU-158]|uniref:Holo-[acyl-carrier-protein] synthase n=1 Tax=Spongiibacter pelagi TaxID=2760804 RepID=A0A927BZQ8_9GAMM|nr:holo-ACP synthase [Spongiibacter pelagi]MBD2858583.1 holo-ACP synthase [Spongiibacter pelagi]
MILGVGTDLLDQKRIEQTVSRFGQRFVHRVLNEQEREQYARASKPLNFLAKRFAVKEAASKALAVGIGAQANLHDFTVVKSASGAPSLQITGVAAETANALGVTHAHVSLSDETPFVLAFVVLSRST